MSRLRKTLSREPLFSSLPCSSSAKIQTPTITIPLPPLRGILSANTMNVTTGINTGAKQTIGDTGVSSRYRHTLADPVLPKPLFLRKAPHFPFSPRRFPLFYGWVILAASVVGTVMRIPGQTMGVGVFTDFLITSTGLDRLTLSTACMLGIIGSSLILPFSGRLLDSRGSPVFDCRCRTGSARPCPCWCSSVPWPSKNTHWLPSPDTQRLLGSTRSASLSTSVTYFFTVLRSSFVRRATSP